MDAIVTALADEHADLARLLADLDEADWKQPSRCEGWSVADVVLHLAQTDEMAIASMEGRFLEYLEQAARDLGDAVSVDEGADLMVARERGQAGAAVRDRWQRRADELRERIASADPGLRVTWVAGEVSARTLATTRVAETWIHAGDVAAAFGEAPSDTDRLWHIARLAWRTLPYAFSVGARELAGPVAFELTSPSGEEWRFAPDTEAITTIRGPALDLCLVAARRVEPSETALSGEGPDATAVLELVRTYA